MVFCGKPSKGCGECRSRKIRCDQARPACSQCTKGSRVCPGYRDQLSLMFRDESQQVIRKARTGPATRKAKPSRKTVPPSSTASPATSDTTTSPGPASSTVSGTIDLPDIVDLDPQLLELVINEPSLVPQPSYQPSKDEAISFFLRQNAWIGTFWSSVDGKPNFHQTLATPSHKAMMASLACVGSAMLSRIRQSTPLRVAAEKEYGNALQLITSAVANEQQAKDNATLAAVLTMAIFEVVCNRAPRSIDNWTNHINGAAALLELRGVEQLQNEQGLKLFIQMRYQIIISCLQREARVPQSVLQCARLALFLRPQAEAYGDRLITIMGRLSNLRADINERILTDEKEILSASYAVEGDLIAWLASLPKEFLFTTVEGFSPNSSYWGPSPYKNRYHVYTDLWICHTWNQYRTARIILCDLILTYIRRINVGSALPRDLVEHCVQVRNTAHQLANDICASVPYHFGDAATATQTLVASSPSSADFIQAVPLEQSFMRGMILLWPLAMAAATREGSHPLHKWVLNCFLVIGNRMYIDQALALIELMRGDDAFYETLVWSEDNKQAYGVLDDADDDNRGYLMAAS
ncbi:C6 finger domain protein [Aspergillus ellipticus CBS 707.79]|uniref:C6 finger domain protein n=1 Tax=Aspergillus ellipticus CBS 707.79 TaxID=1448320 RepID=A0A319DZ67_9EURO|nr:C6 finger domain protein [Aspergillus ellipticus CBS 707.79]